MEKTTLPLKPGCVNCYPQSLTKLWKKRLHGIIQHPFPHQLMIMKYWTSSVRLSFSYYQYRRSMA